MMYAIKNIPPWRVKLSAGEQKGNKFWIIQKYGNNRKSSRYSAVIVQG